MGSILRRKSVLKWAFVALKADIAARVLSRAVADCSCCVRDGRRLLRGWTSLHANWLASVESMRVAHAQKVWLRRSQQRRLLRTWQRRAEWSVPRRRRATAHYSRNAKASALSQLSQGTAISRWKRSLKCVAGRLTLLFVPVFSSPVRMLVVLNSPIALYRCSPVVRSGHGGCGIRSIAYMQSDARCGTRKLASRSSDTSAHRSRYGPADLLHLRNKRESLSAVGPRPGLHHGSGHQYRLCRAGNDELAGPPTVVCKPSLPTRASLAGTQMQGDGNA